MFVKRYFVVFVHGIKTAADLIQSTATIVNYIIIYDNYNIIVIIL